MTHQSGHIIISSLKTSVKGKRKVWHYVAAACLACFIAGALIF